jgi:hypothetical protein
MKAMSTRELVFLIHCTLILLWRHGLLKPEHKGDESQETDEQQYERRYHYHWPEPRVLKILKLDILQNSPMLDNRGEETEDTKADKTQSENHCGVYVFGVRCNPASAKISRNLAMPNPNPISERQVRIQAMRVRSAASRVRSLASSVETFVSFGWSSIFMFIPMRPEGREPLNE